MIRICKDDTLSDNSITLVDVGSTLSLCTDILGPNSFVFYPDDSLLKYNYNQSV